MSWRNLFHDLKKRRFFKELSIYIISAWVVIQVCATTFPYLGLAREWVTLVIVLSLIGLPIWMFIAWRHDILESAKTGDDTASVNTVNGVLTRKMFLQLLGVVSLLVIVVSVLVAKRNFFSNSATSLLPEDRVAVSIFENNTGQEGHDVIGKMISDWITRGLVESDIANVISYGTIQRQARLFQNNIAGDMSSTLLTSVGATKIIEGAYYLEGDTLAIQAHIVDGESGGTLYSFQPTKCSSGLALQCVEELKQRILGYWLIGASIGREKPPHYEAYKNFLKSKEYWDVDYEKVLFFLDKAIAIDSTYTEPHLSKIAVYINLGDGPKAQASYNRVRSQSRDFGEVEEDHLAYYAAFLAADYSQAYYRFREIYEMDPKEIVNNTNMAVLALEYMRRPSEAIEILEQINADQIDYKNCPYCLERLQILARAYCMKGDYDLAWGVLQDIPVFEKRRDFRQWRLKAAIGQGRYDLADSILSRSKYENLDRDYRYLYFTAASEAMIQGNDEQRNTYGESAARLYGLDLPQKLKMHGRALYVTEQWPEALQAVESYLENRPHDLFSRAQYAAIHAYMDRLEVAQNGINGLLADQAQYHPGVLHYHIGRIYAIMKNTKAAVSHLEKAIAEGYLFTSHTYENDPDIQANLEAKDLDHILNYYNR